MYSLIDCSADISEQFLQSTVMLLYWAFKVLTKSSGSEGNVWSSIDHSVHDTTNCLLILLLVS